MLISRVVQVFHSGLLKAAKCMIQKPSTCYTTWANLMPDKL